MRRRLCASRPVRGDETLCEVFFGGLPESFALALKGRVKEGDGFVEVQRAAEEMLKESGKASVWHEVEGKGGEATRVKAEGEPGGGAAKVPWGGKRGGKPVKCYDCGREGHLSRECPTPSGTLKFAPAGYQLRSRTVQKQGLGVMQPSPAGVGGRGVVCWHCQGEGHFARACPTRLEKQRRTWAARQQEMAVQQQRQTMMMTVC